MNNQTIRKMVGWRPVSKMPDTYVHISARHILREFDRLNGGKSHIGKARGKTVMVHTSNPSEIFPRSDLSRDPHIFHSRIVYICCYKQYFIEHPFFSSCFNFLFVVSERNNRFSLKSSFSSDFKFPIVSGREDN